MKPISLNQENPGLLEYLEDIIGTDIYLEDINNLEKEVEKIGEERLL